MNILSGGAAAALVKAMQDAFTQQTGAGIVGTFSAVGMMRDKLLAGEPCDLAILTAPLIEELIRSGHVVAGTKQSLGRVRTGIAVRSGALQMAVSTADELRTALRGAAGIYFPDAEKSTAGRHFMAVLRALGLDQELAPVLRQYPNGETAMREMAACPQAGLIGCTQVTEINGTPGVDLVALLPAEFELATDYTLGICTGAQYPEQARVLAAMLTGPASAAIRRQGGFEF